MKRAGAITQKLVEGRGGKKTKKKGGDRKKGEGKNILFRTVTKSQRCVKNGRRK